MVNFPSVAQVPLVIRWFNGGTGGNGPPPLSPANCHFTASPTIKMTCLAVLHGMCRYETNTEITVTEEIYTKLRNVVWQKATSIFPVRRRPRPSCRWTRPSASRRAARPASTPWSRSRSQPRRRDRMTSRRCIRNLQRFNNRRQKLIPPAHYKVSPAHT